MVAWSSPLTVVPALPQPRHQPEPQPWFPSPLVRCSNRRERRGSLVSKRETLTLFLQAFLPSLAHSAPNIGNRKGYIDVRATSTQVILSKVQPNICLAMFLNLLERFRCVPQSHYLVMGAITFQGKLWNSIVLFGSTILGLLFWMNRQSRIAKELTLKEVNAKVRQAEEELCVKTNTVLMLKMEREKARKELSKNIQECEDLLMDKKSIESRVVEFEEELRLARSSHGSLMSKEDMFKSSLQECEVGYKLLLDGFEREATKVQRLERELESMDLEKHLNESEVLDLRLDLKEEEHCELLEALTNATARVEALGDEVIALRKYLNQEDIEVQKSSSMLSETLAKATASTDVLNQLRNLTDEQERAFAQERETIREGLSLKENEYHCMTSEFASKSVKLQEATEKLRELLEEKRGLERALMEKEELRKHLEAEFEASKTSAMVSMEVSSLMEKLELCRQSCELTKGELSAIRAQIKSESLLLKKEKQACASANKKLISVEETRQKESEIISSLNEKLELMKNQLQFSHNKLSLLSSELEEAKVVVASLESELHGRKKPTTKGTRLKRMRKEPRATNEIEKLSASS